MHCMIGKSQNTKKRGKGWEMDQDGDPTTDNWPESVNLRRNIGQTRLRLDPRGRGVPGNREINVPISFIIANNIV